MGSKKERKIARMEVAQELARLSGQVADGFIEIGSTRAELPDEFFLKRSLKVKKNEINFEFFLNIKADRKQKKSLQKDSPSTNRQKSSKRPYKAKRLKKDIGMMWKALKRCIKSGETFRDKEGFLRALNTYGKDADKKWVHEWKECTDMIGRTIELSGQGRVEEALELCKQIDQMTKSCHKRFK